MGMKVKLTVVIYTLLLFGLVFSSFVSFDVASAQVKEGTVTYDYYVVAGYNMTPTLPSPAPSPPNFTFIVEAFRKKDTNLTSLGTAGYNFGNIYYWGERTWLKWGTRDSPTGSAYARVNITNLLGYDITITELTAEITAGTPTQHWYFPLAEDWFGNHTLLEIDALDPWNSETPPELRPFEEEVDYYTGEVTLLTQSDGDWTAMEVGIPYPEPVDGPASLLEPDWNGDAEATGHVAPIQFANGSTFTEYFGIVIFGVAEEGTQINGTITLALTYTTGAAEFPWLWIGVGVVVIIVVVAAVAVFVRRRK